MISRDFNVEQLRWSRPWHYHYVKPRMTWCLVMQHYHTFISGIRSGQKSITAWRKTRRYDIPWCWTNDSYASITGRCNTPRGNIPVIDRRQVLHAGATVARKQLINNEAVLVVTIGPKPLSIVTTPFYNTVIWPSRIVVHNWWKPSHIICSTTSCTSDTYSYHGTCLPIDISIA